MTTSPRTPPTPNSDDAAPTDAPVETVADAVAEDIAAYALDALDAADRARVEATLAADAHARALLDSYSAVVNLLPYGSHPHPQALPLSVRDATLARARSTRRRPHRRGAIARGGWAFALIAVCLVAVISLNAVGLPFGIGGSNGGRGFAFGATQATAAVTTAANPVTSLRTLPGTTVYEMYAQPAAPGATGRLYLSPDRMQTGLEVWNLPQLPEGRVYQLWFRGSDEVRTSITTFAVDAKGTATLSVPVPHAYRNYVGCGISEEPTNGSAMPTGPRILASNVWYSN